MRFDVTNHNIHALSPETISFGQHLIGLADSRTWSEIDLQLRSACRSGNGRTEQADRARMRENLRLFFCRRERVESQVRLQHVHAGITPYPKQRIVRRLGDFAANRLFG
jgi:hypothetical protein